MAQSYYWKNRQTYHHFGSLERILISHPNPKRVHCAAVHKCTRPDGPSQVSYYSNCSVAPGSGLLFGASRSSCIALSGASKTSFLSKMETPLSVQHPWSNTQSICLPLGGKIDRDREKLKMTQIVLLSHVTMIKCSQTQKYQ